MTHTPIETMWIVRVGGFEEYGFFKSPDDARVFATQTGLHCEISEFRGRLVSSREMTREEYERDTPSCERLYDPSEWAIDEQENHHD